MQRFVPIAWVLAATPQAWCHAVLLQATPQSGASVHGPSIPISLRFNSRIDGKRSRLTLVIAGKEQPLTIAAQSAPDTLTSRIEDAKSGPCRIRWQVLASDGHITRGEIVFQVT